MATVYVTVGPCGSGKSTWAKQQKSTYVGFDEIGDLQTMCDLINTDKTKDYVYEATNLRREDWRFVNRNLKDFNLIGIVFTTSAEQCKENLHKRGDDRLIDKVDEQKQILDYESRNIDKYFKEVRYV